MIDILQGWDHQLFHFINYTCSNAFFDAVLPVLRNKYTWIPVYVFIISYLVVNYGKKSYYALLFLIVTAALCDNISSQLIKKNVERLRPCRNELIVEKHTLVRCGSGYSFTSSHATNHFGISVFLLLLFRRFRKRWLSPILLTWAALVSISQVYVGVHFPLDILCGSILGAMIAFICFRVYQRYFQGELI